jgi:Ca-activated chloride channel family protein
MLKDLPASAQFADPRAFWLLPALLVVYLVWSGRRPVLDAERRRLGLRPEAVPGALRFGMAALLLLIVALARPRWGWVPASSTHRGQDLLLVVDVSRSMAAEDAVPNRLGVAVEAARQVLRSLKHQPGNRAGLVVFSGRAVLRCPLTEYLDAVDDALRSLRPGEVRPGGTDLASALDRAVDAWDDQVPDDGQAVMVFSDGEDHVGAWRVVLPRLKEARTVAHTVAIGDDRAGAPLPSGSGDFLRYQGEIVRSRRSDAPLKAIAQETGGAFLPLGLSEPVNLDAIYRERVVPASRARRTSLHPPEREERFRLFVLAALILLVAVNVPFFTRRGSLPLLAVVALGLLGAGDSDDDPRSLTALGLEQFRQGNDTAALEAFEMALRFEPTSALAHYNVAEALSRLGRFDEAASLYREARERADPLLRAKIDFALGNTALALGQPTDAAAHYEACLAAAGQEPAFDRVRRDAAINRRFALEHRSLSAPPEPESPGPSKGPQVVPPSPREDPRKQTERPATGIAPGSTAPRQTPTGQEPLATPGERLDQALLRIAERQGRRLDVPPPSAPDPNVKDW